VGNFQVCDLAAYRKSGTKTHSARSLIHVGKLISGKRRDAGSESPDFEPHLVLISVVLYRLEFLLPLGVFVGFAPSPVQLKDSVAGLRQIR
jgi:hypothetical protein